MDPLTLFERQVLCVEVAVMFIAFRAGWKRGLNPSLDSILVPVRLTELPPRLAAFSPAGLQPRMLLFRENDTLTVQRLCHRRRDSKP
jgi:hypothetical protein